MDDATKVEVTGMQFAWYFRYPGVDAAFGETRPSLVAPGEGNPLGLDQTDRHSVDDLVTSQLGGSIIMQSNGGTLVTIDLPMERSSSEVSPA